MTKSKVMSKKRKKDIVLAINQLVKIMIRTDEDGNQSQNPFTNEPIFEFRLNGICMDLNNDETFFDNNVNVWLSKSQILEFRNMLNEVITEVYPDEMSEIFI